MKIPVLHGLIDRRILVNYRVRPATLARLLPPPFQPQVVEGFGMAGICLIRLEHVRPRFVPSWLGFGSENAAHRIAVQWDQEGELRKGVYVLRRDTSSRLNHLAGGRVFPGLHHRACFQVQEQAEHYQITMDSDDQQLHVAFEACLAPELPRSSVFRSLAEASAFFAKASLGFSPAAQAGTFDALELRCHDWKATPLTVERAASSYFSDRSRFPPGTVELDHALLMRDVKHEWHAGCLAVLA